MKAWRWPVSTSAARSVQTGDNQTTASSRPLHAARQGEVTDMAAPRRNAGHCTGPRLNRTAPQTRHPAAGSDAAAWPWPSAAKLGAFFWQRIDMAAPVGLRGMRAWMWLALGVMAAAAAWGWWRLGQPVTLPDAPSGRIACVSYAPFRLPGESPLDVHAFVSPERIDADLQALSRRFDCVRTYSQGQGLGAVPAIAQRHGMQVLMGIW